MRILKFLLLLVLASCTSYPKHYDKSEIPDYRKLAEDEKIVFFEVQFVDMTILYPENGQVYTMTKNPNKNPESKTPDFTIKCTIMDKNDVIKRGFLAEFVTDYLYPDKIMKNISNDSNPKSPEFYQNLPSKRIAYLKIKKDDKIRFDRIEYKQDNKARNKVPEKPIFFLLKGDKKVQYLGSNLFISSAKYKNNKDFDDKLTIQLLKKDNDTIKESIKIFHIPSEREIDGLEKN